jgi:hypothetical protein
VICSNRNYSTADITEVNETSPVIDELKLLMKLVIYIVKQMHTDMPKTVTENKAVENDTLISVHSAKIQAN